jgi:TonB family protein
MLILTALVLLSLGQGDGRAVSEACLNPTLETLTQATAALCFAETDERLADGRPADSPERLAALTRAAEQFRRAADTSRIHPERVRAVQGLVRLYAPDSLDRPQDQEAALRELIGLLPEDLDPMFRLAQAQEGRGLIDAAEDTLQTARRNQPENLETYRRLAQFYARRAAAVQPPTPPVVPTPEPAGAPGPDEQGVFRVGGGVAPPPREGVAQVPEAARLLGIEGAVRLEIVVDATGAVSESRVVRSIPLLDEEAMRAVRQWRFAPTLVDGKAVPVRMEVIVNFSLP